MGVWEKAVLWEGTASIGPDVGCALSRILMDLSCYFEDRGWYQEV